MKSLRSLSAARIIQITLSILWVVSIAICVLMVGFFVFICFLPQYDPGGWTIMLDPASIGFSIDPVVEGFDKVRLESGDFEMGFTTPTRAATILFQFSRVIISIIILLMMLYQAKKIAYTWPDNNPFSLKNIRRLRKIALLIIIVPFFHMVDLLTTHYFLLSKFDFPVDPGFFINWDLGMLGNVLSRFKWEFLFFGIGLIALSEVFNKGLEYQEDSTSIL